LIILFILLVLRIILLVIQLKRIFKEKKVTKDN
jgi:hypothetical protein